MTDDESADVGGDVIVRTTIGAAAVGKSGIEVDQLMHVFGAVFKGHPIAQVLQTPHREGQRMHGGPHHRIPDILHSGYGDRTAKNRSGGCHKGLDFRRHFHDVLILIARSGCHALGHIFGDDVLQLVDIQFVRFNSIA